MNRKPVLYRDAKTELNKEANTMDVPTGPGAPESCPGPVAAHSDLAQGDKDYLAAREKIVSLGIKATIATARALFEIYSFGEGRLWKAQHPTFEAYCRERWDLQKSQAYRLVECGKFIAGLEAGAKDDDSPFGERLPQNEGQIRPLMSLPDEHRLECGTRSSPRRHPPLSLPKKLERRFATTRRAARLRVREERRQSSGSR